MSNENSRLDVSLIRSASDTQISEASIDLSDFEDFLVRPKKDAELWSPARFVPLERKDAYVASLCALVLDYDGKAGDPLTDPGTVVSMWSQWEHVVHSSWSHTPEYPKLRVVVPLTRSVTPAEHADLYAWALAYDPRIDPACRNPGRFFYWPARKAVDAPVFFRYNSGGRLDPDSLAGRTRDRTAAHVHAGSSRRLILPVSKPPPTPAREGAEGHGGGGADAPPNPFAQPERKEDFSRVLEGCAFVQHAVRDAETLPEPEWRAVLSLLTRCEEGEALAHAISQPYHGYSEDETQWQYERLAMYGPMTCAKISDVAGARWCAGCPHAGRITSPVQLGAPPPAPAEPPAQRVARLVKLPVEEREAAVEDAMEQAEERAQAARAAEGEAIGRRDAARRRYTLASKPGASEEERDQALAARMAADAEAREATAARRRAETHLERLRTASAVVGLPPGANAEVWTRLTLVSPSGVVKPADTVGNVLRIFDEDPRWSDRLTFNAFNLEVCLDGKTLPEEKATDLTAQLAYDYLLDTTTARVKECARASSRRRTFHPVCQYLDGLEWDGVSRVDTTLFEGFGVEPGGEWEPVLRKVSRRFLISLVARVRDPGCQVDTMLVLHGEGGIGKSRALEALVGTEWFARTKLTIGDKDSYMQLRGRWLYEVAEFEGMRRADANAQKAFLSDSVDTYRAPYASSVTSHPRQTVLAGTTNDKEILIDPTGNRRFWPATCSRPLDRAWVRANRDALFAEASVLYARGVAEGWTEETRWWFEPDEVETALLKVLTEEYEVQDAWRYPVVQWLIAEAKRPTKTPAVFTAEDVIMRVFNRQDGDITHNELTRVGRLLSKIGISSARTRLAGSRQTYYYMDVASKQKLGVLVDVGGEVASHPEPSRNNPFGVSA